MIMSQLARGNESLARKEKMTLKELLNQLVALAEENPASMNCEVLAKNARGELAIANKAIHQPDADEIQIFVADC